MIAPREPWHRFDSDTEKLSYLRSIKLQPKTKTKPIYYTGPYVAKPTTCNVVGYDDTGFLVISIDGELHSIHKDHLLEMQKSTTAPKEESKNQKQKTSDRIVYNHREERCANMGLGFRIVLDGNGSATIQNNTGIQRPEKGKSLLVAAKDFTAIDIETTGLSPMFDEIIEISAVRYRSGAEAARLDQLIDPGIEIDPFITQLTGITNEMLQGMPQIGAALPEFLAFVGDDLIVGHNVNFDINFIYDACVDLGLSPLRNDFVDTMRVAKRLYLGWPNYKLDTLLGTLGIGARSQHRAGNDAQLTAEAYLVMAAEPGFDAVMKPASYNTMAKTIVAREGLENENSPLFGKVCVFTGALESFTRHDAMQLVADIGGICADSVTKKTNLLILGNNDYCKSIKDGKSSKQKKAEKLILEGADLQIIPESVFLDMLADG